MRSRIDFLTLQEKHLEKDLEKGLIAHVEKLLLELGKGFSFVGRQHHVVVDQADYYIDLLFYHYKLRCFVVIELKAREFHPTDAGQVNFYLSTIDAQMKSEFDNPTIGLILCTEKKDLTVRYALQRLNSPIGVAEYHLEILKSLPDNLKSSLPTLEEFEIELEKQELLTEDVQKKD